MTNIAADAANAREIAFWNGPAGRRWVKRQQTWDVVLNPVAEALLERAKVKPGERVVDIGCGAGATTIELGRHVGPAGLVLGVDVSAPLLARATERVPKSLSVALVEADASTYRFERGYDLLFSRFGVMFFSDPARAFANLRSALRPGGRLVFACFRDANKNPFMMTALAAAYKHVPPLPKLGPEDPGPFSFAPEARVTRILGEAGFQSVALEPLDLALDIAAGHGLDEAVSAALEIGPTSRAIEDQPSETREAVAASIREALTPFQRGASVPLAAAIWIVTAASP